MDLKRWDEGADTDLMIQFCLPNLVKFMEFVKI